jgi:hypothetical protein
MQWIFTVQEERDRAKGKQQRLKFKVLQEKT